MKSVTKFVASIGVGALGGWICGFIILTFCFFIGKSGDKGGGQEGFGYWNPWEMLGLAGFYGLPIGVLIFPVGYLMFLRNLRIDKALMFATAGTLGGGLIGALIGPPIAALLDVVGFFIASSIAASL